MEKCDYCHKEIGDNFVEKNGKKFCSGECLSKWEEENSSDSENVCEFC